jgi:hypothetical protein
MPFNLFFKKCIQVLFFLLAVYCTAMPSHAQSTQSKKAYLDSLMNLLSEEQKDSLNSSLDLLEEPIKSVFDISIGVSNGRLTKTNLRKDTTKTFNKAFLTPIISYTHKTGIGASYQADLVPDKSSLLLLQHKLSLYYEYSRSNNYSFGFSVGKYFRQDSFPYDPTVFDNEYAANFTYLKSYFQPSLLLSYSAGKYTETIKRPLITIINKTKVKDVSAVLAIQHSYYITKGMGAGNVLYFIPKIMLISGAQKFSSTSTSNFPANLNPLLKRKIITNANNNGSIPRSYSANFQPQSLGIELDATYYFGKFYIEPNLYLDYYLHVDDNRFTTIGSLTVGVRL